MKNDPLIKSKERVKKFAEVFTPPEVVSDMLDMLGEVPADATYMEPACGNGNFLVQILERKLKRSVEPHKALQQCYGVDIQEDNIMECRERLKKIVSEVKADETGFYDEILKKNIIVGDFIHGQDKIIIHDWINGTDQTLEEISNEETEPLHEGDD